MVSKEIAMISDVPLKSNFFSDVITNDYFSLTVTLVVHKDHYPQQQYVVH